MIHIDKLVIAFKLRIEYFNSVTYQFDTLKRELEKIDRLNDNPNLDLIEYLNTEITPYTFGKTELKRADLKEVKTHFKYNYWVFVDNKKIGLLQWETYGNGKNYGYVTLCNEVLYNEDWKLYKQSIKDLKLTISHISKLDIAYDTPINPTKRYLDIICDKENEIIINGDIIKDRNKLLKTPYFLVYGTLNEPYKYPQINLNTKDKSSTIRCYNKTEEINEKSHKNYIKEKFNGDKDIYRCEVSLNTHSVNRLVDNIINTNGFDTEEEGLNLLLKNLESTDYLLTLHKKTLFRLFRYSKRGEKLSYYNIKL